MTANERVQAVAKFGFTERQAAFLTTVMLHGGLCVRRQYARFAGTAYGRNVNGFFEKLERGRQVVWCDCVHNRAKLYHVRDRGLYRAIGDANSRYQRPVAPRAVFARLMRLDAVIEHPEVRWLVNDDERLAFLSEAAPAFSVERLRHVPVGARRRVRLVPDDLLIGVDSTDRVVFLHVISAPLTDAFRFSLQRCGDLLRTLPAWTLKFVYPAQFSTSIDVFLTGAREELETPLPTGVVEELRGYFEQLRSRGRSQARGVDPLFWQRQEAFAAPRFRVLYRRWLSSETAIETASSPAIRDAIAAGAGRIEWTVLPMQYEHLSPLASLVRPRPKGVEEGEEGGTDVLQRLNPPQRLRSATPWGPSAIGVDSRAVRKALLSQPLGICGVPLMGGVVCRPFTAAAVAITTNRSVNDPASRPATRPRGGPRVVHATVPRDQFFVQIAAATAGCITRESIALGACAAQWFSTAKTSV